jgi:hypothetical protein
MDFPLPRFLARCPHAVLPWLLVALACTAAAQQDSSQFPAAAVMFLSQELPQMETAIKERDGDYFQDATSRMLDFSDSWGFKTHDNPALASYAMCTEPVSDFLVVGMCRVMTTADSCEPGLAARFNSNLQKCREIAAKQ